MRRLFRFPLLLLTGLSLLSACTDDGQLVFPLAVVPGVTLTPVAASRVQWTGVAITKEGRLFANFPRMETDTIPYSVAVINGDQATPFPNAEWNSWNPSFSPQDHFVCVQSVYVDADNYLWVLDAAAPLMRGTVRGGPKLLKFDPTTGQLLQRILFDETIAFPASYLNDVRVDTQKKIAYITDSNRGAIIVVNLATEKSRRLLNNHPSTKSENLVITAEGRVWRDPSGKLPSIDSDGLALSPDRAYVYYHALTATSLYRIGTQYLQDESLSESQLGQHVELVSKTNPPDGMIFDPKGNLYLTDVENNAVTRRTPSEQVQLVAKDAQLKWPDSFAVGADGALYVTTSQLHIPRAERTEPYRIFKITIPQ